MEFKIEERDSIGYIGVCYEEHCHDEATSMLIHHHHKGFECDVERTDDNHCAMFFCDKHSEDTVKGKKVAIKPEIVNRHEG